MGSADSTDDYEASPVFGNSGRSVCVPRLLGTPFAADLESGHCYTTMPGAKLVATCGYWDNSVRCYSIEDGRLLQSLRQHKDIVTCIAVGADGETLVTGAHEWLITSSTLFKNVRIFVVESIKSSVMICTLHHCCCIVALC